MKNSSANSSAKRKNSSANSSVSYQGSLHLTQTEKEIYHYLINDYLSVKQIATRRKTTTRAVRKTMQRLKEKGVISEKNNIVPISVCGPELSGTFRKPIRLHGVEFNIKILFKDQRYKEIIEKKGNTLLIDGNTIRLYRDAVEIYLIKSFYGTDPSASLRDCFNYSTRMFYKLENDLKIQLIKPRVQNIRMVKSHFSEINNEFAKECGDKHEKIQVRTREDGKVWFLIDNSFNLHEAETIHSETSKNDMEEVVQPFFNDMRHNKGVLMSDLAKSMSQLVEMQKSSQNQLNALIEVINVYIHIPQSIDKNKKLDSYIG